MHFFHIEIQNFPSSSKTHSQHLLCEGVLSFLSRFYGVDAIHIADCAIILKDMLVV